MRTEDKGSFFGGGVRHVEEEKYELPTEISLIDNILYVVDKNRHRVLKYDRNGEPVKFDRVVADLRNTYRDKHNKHYGFEGTTIDKYLVYTNSLNDTIEYDEWDFIHHNVNKQHY